MQATLATLALTAVLLSAVAAAQGLEPAHQSIYSAWKQGPPTDPGFFPIGVWAQAPRDAAKYRKIGVNFYMSLHRGPTVEQLAELRKAGMLVICHQNQVGLEHVKDPKTKPIIIAWMHGDEPDNFRRDPETNKWVPKRSTEQIIGDYERIRKADPNRPVLLNLGQGVANVGYKGGWAKDKDYREFTKGCDIVSFDIYPACSNRPEVADKLWLTPFGVDRLRELSGGRKIVWNILECTAIHAGSKKATPDEVKAQVWMSLIHGSKGVVYFCHEFPNDPQTGRRRTISNALLRDAEMSKAVGAINKQVRDLAPVLNTPTVANGVTVTVANEKVPVDIMVKRHGGDTYVFAVAMRPGETGATFTLRGVSATAKVEVIGEDRELELTDGRFSDTFGRYQVHLYKIVSAATEP